MNSPALSVHSAFSDMDDDELDNYLAQCVPLSNLPTPPPAKEPLAALPTPPPDADTHLHSPELHAYARHLANLVPRNVSTQKPSASVIAGFLARAGLPVEIVAFAGCILDALSSRFAGLWRQSCVPRATADSQACFGLNFWQWATALPDLIVLAALALAHGFTDDRGRCNSHWAGIEGNALFTAKEVELTKMCILSDMDYGLFRISDDMVQHMIHDLQLVGNFPTSFFLASKDAAALEQRGEERRPKFALGRGTLGTAMWSHGVQTPEPSP